VADFNAAFGTRFSDEKCQTVGGLILQPPRPGAAVQRNDRHRRHRFQVLRADSRRIYTWSSRHRQRRAILLNKAPGWRCLGAAAASGAVGVAGFAPLGWFPVNWLSLGGLFALLPNRD
jgi:hypothetical protein